MLFNSFEFIFLFLPITLFVFFVIGSKKKYRTAMFWLVLCSLFFYGWWNPSYLILILFSILFNYFVATFFVKGMVERTRKLLLFFGIGVNLTLIGYFKYANFFVDQVLGLIDTSFHLNVIILPLAISFFTFQQIAFLVDAYRGETKEYNFLNYCLFVTFFPQLIAGPIVHHKEMLPQFSKSQIFRFNNKHIAIGLFIFTIGLVKKVIFADTVAVYATSVFDAAGLNLPLTFFDAWGGSLAYSLQLYFDFSGYSDMAIGIAYMFGIKLPINFNSPYKAVSIIDFWRRWHITLSKFLREYLYFSLGGNKKGTSRRYINLFLTMLLGGLWHGAGWTFIIWGMLHGFYLIINHAWRKIRRDILKWTKKVGFVERLISRMITLLAIVIGWVYFRAETLSSANFILYTMSGVNGISLPESMSSIFGNALDQFGIVYNGMFGSNSDDFGIGIKWVAFLIIIALFTPNFQQLMQGKYLKSIIKVNNKLPVLGIISGFAWYFIVVNLTEVSEFLYFNF